MRTLAVLAPLALAGALGGGWALADGGSPAPGAGVGAPHALTATDLPGIPSSDRGLTVASERWQRLTRPPVASLRGLSGAHPGTTSIRVSRRRAALTDRRGRQRFPYPRRTVIVKTGTVAGTVTLVAIMRKVSAGTAPASWRYVEYTRDRAGRPFTRVGGGQSLCSDCHVSATTVQGSDAVFTRLR